MPPGRIPGAILEEAGENAILVSDGGDIHTWAITVFRANAPGSLLATHDALGTIGVGVPYALGAKAAAPDRPVVMCIGDGSFGFGAHGARDGRAAQPAVRGRGRPTTARGATSATSRARSSRRTTATQLSVAAYEKIAEAFGGYAERVEDAAEVGPAIRRAIDSNKPAVVNVIVQPGAVSQITEMVGGMMAML